MALRSSVRLHRLMVRQLSGGHLRRRMTRSVALTAAGALAVTLAQVTPDPVAAAPVRAEAAPKVTERPDRTSAMVAAVSQDSRVEDLSARTPSAAMFANPNGTWTLESHAGLVRSKDDDDKWVAVDPALESTDDGVTPAAVPFDVEYGDGGSKDLATVTSASGSTLSVDWPSKLPDGAVDGDKVTFEPSSITDAADGDGDLVVTSFAEGFNFSVVLNQAPATTGPADGSGGVAASPEYRFPLSLSQGRFVERADGAIDIKSGGKIIGSVTAPVMWDSSDEPKAVPVKAVLEGDATAADRVLVLRPDPAYLADPERVYPVTVDPTVVLTATGDTWVQNLLPNTSQHTSTELRVGTNNAGINQNRSYLNFDTSALGSPQPGSITDAKVSLSNFTAGSCSGSAIKMSQVTSAWTVPGITWSNKPTVTATGASTNDAAHGFTGCTSEDVVDFDATEIVKSWAGGATNHGVELTAVTLNNASYRKYRSLENGDNAKSPKLTVTIGQRPATPTGLTAAPGLYNNFITSKTPTLSTVVTDPDGGQVKGYFEVKQSSTLVWSGTSTAVASGGTATIDVPSGELSEATTYTISAWGEDDTNNRSTTPATKTVTVDTIAPTATITSAQFTNGNWTTTVPGSDTVTVDGSADTGGFYLNYDGVTNAAGANSSGDRVTTYTPTPGWHVYEVTPVDKAGNFGAPVTFTYGTGAGAFTTPTQWTPSTASFPVDFSGPPSATGATLQWRLAGETTWRTATKVKKTDGTNWTGSITGTGRSTTGALIWNATQETYGSGTLTAPGLIETKGCFQYTSSADSCTTNLLLSLFKSAVGGRFPSTNIGPGAEVALITGEVSMNSPDAVDSKAGIGRSYSSLSDSTLTAGVFGPGWSDPDIFNSVNDASSSIVDNRLKDGTLIVVDAGSGSQTFAPTGAGVYKPVRPTGDATTLTLTTGSPDTLALSRPLGTSTAVTTWEWKTADTGADPAWILKATNAPGVSSDIVVTSTSQRPTFVMESDPAAAATCSISTQTEGCRALKITYTGSGSATRVSAVERIIGAATPGAVVTKTLATYTYTSGTLTKVCSPDPDGVGSATPLCTEYTYSTVVGRTLLATVKPAGLTAWRFGYDSIGRLENVKRGNPGGGDSTWSIDYNLSTTSPGLPDMGAAKVAEWGQQVTPSKVYAIYEPYSGSADITKADLVYTDKAGAITNTATYGPNGWLVETDWVNNDGQTVQSLDSTGWARVQAAPVADRPRVALEASSFREFNTWGTAETIGTRVVDEYGPAHTASLENGTIGYFRTHTSYVHDDTPGVDPGLLTGRPSGAALGLLVKATTSTSTADRSTDHDHKITTYGYAPAVVGDGDGWNLGQPTSVSRKVDGSTWSTTISRFDAEGREIETRQPGGGAASNGAGNDARSTTTSYYTSSGSGDCGGKPAWAGLVCKSGPAAQPSGTTIPIRHNTGFDADLNPTTVQEISNGAVKRTTTGSYDDLGRPTSISVAVNGSGVTADTVTTTHGYDASTGLPTTTVGSSGSVGTITASYDSWGRETGYTDSTGNSGSTTYDATGRVAVTDTGAAATTYSYDDHGVLTGVAINSGVGAYDYTYRSDGSIAEVDYPNGLTASYQADEIGTPTGITYANSAGTLLAFTTASDASGRTLRQSSSASSQAFNYDGLSRLTRVTDTRSSGCTTRLYGFLPSSERSALTAYGPASGGDCQETTGASTKTNSYDSANRITNTGYNYDPLGRTLTVPATDVTAGGTAALSATYRANDMIESMSQTVATAGGGTETKATSYTLDPVGRISVVTYKTNGTETKRLRYRYGGSADSPASIDTSTDAGSTWTGTKYVSAIGMGLSAEITGSAVTFQLANPHGDVVGTADSSGAVLTYGETDEYGNAQPGASPVRYGWLGTQQRSTDTVGGLFLMGARLYNPSTGLFLSADAVHGGGANPYSYPTDPINMADTTGHMWTPWGWAKDQVKKILKQLTQFIMWGAVSGDFLWDRSYRLAKWLLKEKWPSRVLNVCTYIGWYVGLLCSVVKTLSYARIGDWGKAAGTFIGIIGQWGVGKALKPLAEKIRSGVYNASDKTKFFTQVAKQLGAYVKWVHEITFASIWGAIVDKYF